MRTKNNPSILRGIITGVAAGIAATLIMDQFQKLATAGQKQQQAAEQEDSTEIVARKIAEAAGTQLGKDEKKIAGQAVHYTFGTLMGVVYSVSAEMLPEVTTGAGTAFGTLLFLGAHEIAVPAFQLAPAPQETPATDHLQHWAAHVVYGGSLEMVRSLIKRLM